MSLFYASVSGSRGTEATKTGDKKTGIHAHIRSWDFGIAVSGFLNNKGEQVFQVQVTGGSNNSSPKELIGIWIDGKKQS